MPDIRIQPATGADINHVSANLRAEHIRELEATSGLAAPQAVRLSVFDSAHVFAGRLDAVPVFLAGVSRKPLLATAGGIWMAATEEIDRAPLEMAMALRRLFASAHDLAAADVLEQWIPAWYRKGIKWLRWLGWQQDGERMIRGILHYHMTHTRNANHGA